MSFESYFRKFAQLLIYRGIHLHGSHVLFEGNNEVKHTILEDEMCYGEKLSREWGKDPHIQ